MRRTFSLFHDTLNECYICIYDTLTSICVQFIYMLDMIHEMYAKIIFIYQTRSDIMFNESVLRVPIMSAFEFIVHGRLQGFP